MTSRASKVSRRSMLGGILCLPAVSVLARSTTPIPITIVSGNTLTVTSLELINGLTGGHFETAGLRVDLQAANSGIAGMQQLVAGRCLITRVHAVEVFKAAARHNASLVAIANLEQEMSYMLASAPDRPVASPAALAGKRVGVFAIGSTTDSYLDLVLHQAGIAPDKVERQVVPATPAAFMHVRQGRLDAVVMTRELVLALRQAGEPHTAWSMARHIRMPGRCYVTTREAMESRPDVVLAFVRGLLSSMREISAGPIRPVLDRAARGFPMPPMGGPALSEAVVASDADSWVAHGPENLLRSIPEIWRDARVVLAASAMAKVEDETLLYTNRFIDRALSA